MVGAVVLVFGPGGGGKSTTAQMISSRLGWHHLEEDERWVERNWRGLRTEDQEAQVQADVLRDIARLTGEGTSVVLDFILYKAPPNPLTAYRTALDEASISHCAIALRPSIDVVMDRMASRGRPNDLANLDLRREGVAHQLEMLSYVDPTPHLTIDSTELSADHVGDLCIETIASVLPGHLDPPLGD